MGATARRSRERGAEDADHDRPHGNVLVAPGVLAQHPLREEHEHEQADRERGLHDHERGQQQRDDLQRPSQDRQTGPEQPASAPEKAPGQSEAQVLLVRSLLGVHRLEGDP